jgi:hypothetical protein
MMIFFKQKNILMDVGLNSGLNIRICCTGIYFSYSIVQKNQHNLHIVHAFIYGVNKQSRKN